MIVMNWRNAPLVVACVASFLFAAIPFGYMVWYYGHEPEAIRSINQATPVWWWGFLKALTWLPAAAATISRHYLPPLFHFCYPLEGAWSPYGLFAVPNYWVLSNPYLWLDFLRTFGLWLAVLVPPALLVRKLVIKV